MPAVGSNLSARPAWLPTACAARRRRFHPRSQPAATPGLRRVGAFGHPTGPLNAPRVLGPSRCLIIPTGSPLVQIAKASNRSAVQSRSQCDSATSIAVRMVDLYSSMRTPRLALRDKPERDPSPRSRTRDRDPEYDRMILSRTSEIAARLLQMCLMTSTIASTVVVRSHSVTKVVL